MGMSFVKKLAGFSIGPVIGAFISLITIPITTYFVSPDEYGKASMFILFQMIFATVIYLGLDQAFVREYHSVNDKSYLIKNSISIPIILSIIILCVIAINPTFFSNVLFGEPQYIIPTILFGIMLLFMVLERFILLSIRMEEKALEYSVLNIMVKMVILVSTLIFIFFIRRDFLAVVYSSIIGQIIGDIYLLLRYRRLVLVNSLSLDMKFLKKILAFGFPLLIASSISIILNSLDRLALRTFSDFFELGIFTATLKIVAVLTIIQTSFTNFWIPTAYRWYEEKRNIEYFKFISQCILLVMTVVFSVILVFKELIVTILSSQYADARYIVALLCLQPILYTVSETTSLGIAFSRKTVLNMWVGILSLIPNLILNLTLVPFIGAKGAAVATAVAYLVFFISRSLFSQSKGVDIKVRLHIVVALGMFFIGLINLVDFKNIFWINIFITTILLLVQINTLKKVYFIIKSKFNKDTIYHHIHN